MADCIFNEYSNIYVYLNDGNIVILILSLQRSPRKLPGMDLISPNPQIGMSDPIGVYSPTWGNLG